MIPASCTSPGSNLAPIIHDLGTYRMDLCNNLHMAKHYDFSETSHIAICHSSPTDRTGEVEKYPERSMTVALASVNFQIQFKWLVCL